MSPAGRPSGSKNRMRVTLMSTLFVFAVIALGTIVIISLLSAFIPQITVAIFHIFYDILDISAPLTTTGWILIYCGIAFALIGIALGILKTSGRWALLLVGIGGLFLSLAIYSGIVNVVHAALVP